MRLRAQLEPPSKDKLYLTAPLGGTEGYLVIPSASLNLAFTVKSEEEGEHLERIGGSRPTLCFLHWCTIVPTHRVRPAVCWEDYIAPLIHWLNKTLLKGKYKWVVDLCS